MATDTTTTDEAELIDWRRQAVERMTTPPVLTARELIAHHLAIALETDDEYTTDEARGRNGGRIYAYRHALEILDAEAERTHTS